MKKKSEQIVIFYKQKPLENEEGVDNVEWVEKSFKRRKEPSVQGLIQLNAAKRKANVHSIVYYCRWGTPKGGAPLRETSKITFFVYNGLVRFHTRAIRSCVFRPPVYTVFNIKPHFISFPWAVGKRTGLSVVSTFNCANC